ncbi:MAG: alanine dehydrogenase [Parachlamydiales bacterium]
MEIGIPREVKEGEGRVAVTPEMVTTLVAAGHRITIERGAGAQAGYLDSAYAAAGAQIAPSPREVYAATFVLKVKEPQESEFGYLRTGQILFCYLHLAANVRLARVLKEQRVLAVGYETVTDDEGRRPLLVPMSTLAGRIAVQEGAHHLGTPQGGKGVLIGRGRVVVLGAGTVGFNAAEVAIGMGAQVVVFDKSESALARITGATTAVASPESIAREIATADLVIGAVFVPEQATPRLITRKMLKGMEPGSVFVDVGIDQGGCSQTSRPTTLSKPTYVEEGVIHYCVPNMPGAFPKSASAALCQATLPYVLQIASAGKPVS